MSAIAVVPSETYRDAFLSFISDFEERDINHAAPYVAAKNDFALYVAALLNEEQGVGLRDGWVPCTHRWLIGSGGVIVGVFRVRHRIDTPFLTKEGGHIGYDVAPSWRGSGYGHAALNFALIDARRLGLDRVLLIANESNMASRKVIERRGGQLAEIEYSQYWKQPVCRYWISAGANDA